MKENSHLDTPLFIEQLGRKNIFFQFFLPGFQFWRCLLNLLLALLWWQSSLTRTWINGPNATNNHHLLITCFVLGSSSVPLVSNLPFTRILRIDQFIMPILQMKKLKPKEIKQLAQGRTANKWRNQESTSGLSYSCMPLSNTLFYFNF